MNNSKLIKRVFMLIFAITLAYQGIFSTNTVFAQSNTEIWWPLEGSKLPNSNVPFKAIAPNHNVSDYQMFWSVDDGGLVPMNTSYQEYPHKEAVVNLKDWNWRANGPYKLNFVTKNNNGNIIGQKSINIFVDQPNTTAPTLIVPAVIPVHQLAQTNINPSLNVWWPLNNANLSGITPFKASMDGKNINEYKMYWRVDTGNEILMPDNFTNYPHKEVDVDLTNWNWNSNGTYLVTFIAKDNLGNIIAEVQKTVFIKNGTTTQQAVTQATQLTSLSVQTVPYLFSAKKLFVNPSGIAQRDMSKLGSGLDKDMLQKIASNSQAIWLGSWTTTLDLEQITRDANSQGAIATYVFYNIPSRDCGGYSAGGANNPNDYMAWVKKMSEYINSGSIVVLEPDALPLIDCLSENMKNERYSLLNYVVNILKQKGIIVYIDAGHPGWLSPDEISNRLKKAGVADANGFSLNVSNFDTTENNIDYGNKISQKVDGKHFVIDTSRNGNGSNGEWCNPLDRALGNRPTTSTGSNLVDAYLWIKYPGESDGNCNGGLSAGTWWREYALGLALRAKW